MSENSNARYLDFVTLDVFTETRFKGNPLAIVRVPRNVALAQDRKQAIAREFNISETVFLYEWDGRSQYRQIDIFTTSMEIPFAGHPTIGTICYLCADNSRSATDSVEKFTIRTKAGSVAASFNHTTRSATADIPHKINIHQARVPWKYILEAQPSLDQGQTDEGQCQLKAWRHRADGLEAEFPLVSIVDGMNFVLVEFTSAVDCLEKLRSDQGAIDPRVARLDEGWSSGILAPYYYVVLPDESRGIVRIRTRMIMQGDGEDPATGSAASALASYLSLQRGGSGKTYTYEIDQGVEIGRSSKIGVQVILADDGNSVGQVLLSGSAITIMQGALAI